MRRPSFLAGLVITEPIVGLLAKLAVFFFSCGALSLPCFFVFCGSGEVLAHPFRRRFAAGRWCGCRGLQRVFRLVELETFVCCLVLEGVGVLAMTRTLL